MSEVLFTIIVDYGGGTFLSQYMANSPDSVMIVWANEVDLQVMGVEESARKEILEEFEDHCVVPLTGLVSVWCIAFSIAGKLAIINIVHTVTLWGRSLERRTNPTFNF